MNAPDTQALSALLEREEADRDAAALALRQAEDHLARVRAQAEQLGQYRLEYIERWQAHFKGHAAIEIVLCYRSFMQRLDQAVTQQQALSERAQSAAGRSRQLLVEAEMRVAAVRKLISRRVEEHRRAVDRREQKQTDEAAQRAGWLASQSSLLAPVF